MNHGAQQQLLGGSAILVALLALPGLGIALAMGVQNDAADFLVAFVLIAATTGGLIVACFYDAYGPVIDAQAQAAQQKAFNMAVSVGQTSVEVAMAASAPNTALKTLKDHVGGDANVCYRAPSLPLSLSLSLSPSLSDSSVLLVLALASLLTLRL